MTKNKIVFENPKYVVEVCELHDEERMMEGMYKIYNKETNVLEHTTQCLPDALLVAENMSLALEKEHYLWARRKTDGDPERMNNAKVALN